MPIEVIRKDKEEMENTKLKNMEESKIERPETVDNDPIEDSEFECNIPGLTQKQLKRLHECYKQIDQDGSDSINRAEFVTWVGQAHAEEFYGVLHLRPNNDSDISFEEFVIQVFKICTFDRDHLIAFALICTMQTKANLSIVENWRTCSTKCMARSRSRSAA